MRHDRLWSMAGMSLVLAKLNEITLPKIIKDNGGTPLLASGGKLTARFPNRDKAVEARDKLWAGVAKRLPMLEFQVNREPIEAASLTEAKEKGLVEELSAAKRAFRGSALSFNPHLARCVECGDYPAHTELADEGGHLCTFCQTAKDAAFSLNTHMIGRTPDSEATTIERVYQDYLSGFENLSRKPRIPLNFDDLFAGRGKERRQSERERMAVWFSDINGLGGKVGVWLQQDEDDIPGFFSKVSKIFIATVVKALNATFPQKELEDHTFLPFRIIVAGGDDLWLVMDEEYGLTFAQAYHKAIADKVRGQTADSPLSVAWLEKNADPKQKKNFTEYSFGGALVVTSSHTSFRAVHHLAENLVKETKEKSGRRANALTWRFMGDDQSLTETKLAFDKPLFLSESASGPDLESYLKAIKNEAAEKLSGSHRQQVARLLFEHQADPAAFEYALKRLAGTGLPKKDFDFLLLDPLFRKEGILALDRIATFLELKELAAGGKRS